MLGQLASQGYHLYRAYDDVSLLLVTPRAAYAQLLAAALEQRPLAAAAARRAEASSSTRSTARSSVQLASLQAAARLKLSAAQVQADVLQLGQMHNISYVAQERFHRALGLPGRRLVQAAGSCPGECQLTWKPWPRCVHCTRSIQQGWCPSPRCPMLMPLPSLCAALPDRVRTGTRETTPYAIPTLQATDPVVAAAAKNITSNALFCVIDT